MRAVRTRLCISVQPVEAGNGPSTGGASLLARSGGGTAVAEAVVEAPAVHVSLNNKIKQVASGRFGVTAEYLVTRGRD